MLKIRFVTGNLFDEIKESIFLHDENIKREVKELGEKTAEKMNEVITSNKKRPQAGEPTTLEDNIDVTHYKDGSGWGVGEISKLDKNAPYWRAVNFGSSHLVGKTIHGQFEPGEPKPNPQDGANRTGRLKTGWYTVTIKNPILPMNYIEKTINFVRRQINNLKMKK
jgi:hypothetical protein